MNAAIIDKKTGKVVYFLMDVVVQETNEGRNIHITAQDPTSPIQQAEVKSSVFDVIYTNDVLQAVEYHEETDPMGRKRQGSPTAYDKSPEQIKALPVFAGRVVDGINAIDKAASEQIKELYPIQEQLAIMRKAQAKQPGAEAAFTKYYDDVENIIGQARAFKQQHFKEG